MITNNKKGEYWKRAIGASYIGTIKYKLKKNNAYYI